MLPWVLLFRKRVAAVLIGTYYIHRVRVIDGYLYSEFMVYIYAVRMTDLVSAWQNPCQ